MTKCLTCGRELDSYKIEYEGESFYKIECPHCGAHRTIEKPNNTLHTNFENINNWFDFLKIISLNGCKFDNIEVFYLDKEKTELDNYIELRKGAVRLFINDDEKTVSVVERYGSSVVELVIATRCDYNRYIKIIEACFDIKIERN